MTDCAKSTCWDCPLLGRPIEEGRCLDVNYERLGAFSGDAMIEIMQQTRHDLPTLNATCEACTNNPLKAG